MFNNYKKRFLSPFALSVRRKTNVSKGTYNLFLGPILRYVFASQKPSDFAPAVAESYGGHGKASTDTAGRTVLTIFLTAMATQCSAYQLSLSSPAQGKPHVICINSKKIVEHEQYVAQAQKRYRYIKPALTLSSVSLVAAYLWYTSSSLSKEEVKKIRDLVAKEEQQKILDSSWKEWSQSNAISVGGVAVELIGGALIIPPLSELIGTLTGSAYIMSSLELYDKEYTQCHALITQMARDMQMSLAAQASGKPVTIGIHEVVNSANRLMQRMEKLLGFMRVTLRKFPQRSLRQEAQAIEKRFIQYTNELCADISALIDEPTLDFAVALEIVLRFAQQYAQEIQRFSFLEQDAQDAF